MAVLISAGFAIIFILAGFGILRYLNSSLADDATMEPLSYTGWAFLTAFVFLLFCSYGMALFFPLGKLRWVITLPLVGLCWMGWRDFPRLWRIWNNREESLAFMLKALLMVLSIAVIAWWVWRGTNLLLFDGTANHDSYFYVTGADLALRYPLWAPPDHLPVALKQGAGMFGVDAGESRAGALVIIALMSTLTGLEPIQTYGFTGLFLLIGFMWAAYAFVSKITPLRSKTAGFRISVLIMLLLSPPVMTAFFEGFYANLLADVLLIAALGAGWMALQGKHYSFFLLAALAINLLGVTYPESLVVGVAIFSSVIFIAMYEEKTAAKRYLLLWRSLTLVGLAVLVNPSMVLQVWNTLILRAGLTGGPSLPDYFMAQLPFAWLAAVLLTLLMNYVPILPALCGTALLFLLLWGLLYSEIRRWIIAALLVFYLMAIKVVNADFHYGEYKTILYIGPLLYLLVVAVWIELYGRFLSIKGKSLRVINVALWPFLLIGLPIMAGVLCGLGGLMYLAGFQYAEKHIDAAYFALRNSFDESVNKNVLIANNLYRSEQMPFFKGHWLSYFTLAWSPIYQDAVPGEAFPGGYVGALFSKGNFPDTEHIDRAVVPVHSLTSTVPVLSGQVLGTFGDAAVLDLSESVPLILPLSGIYWRKDNTSWMGQEAWFEVRHTQPTTDSIHVTIDFCGPFSQILSGRVVLLSDAEQREVTLEKGHGRIEFNLTPGYHRLGLRALDLAVPQTAVERFETNRPLSYQVCRVAAISL